MQTSHSAPTAHYGLHGLVLAVTCDSVEFAAVVDSVMDYFGICSSAPESGSELHLRFTRSRASSRLYERPAHVIHQNGIDMWKRGTCFFVADGRMLVRVDPAAGAVHGFGCSDGRAGTGLVGIRTMNLVIYSILLLIRHRSFYPLHAAGLARDGHGVLLVAASDAGKSTTAMNLVRSGWSYLSDDSVLLRPLEDRVEAWPLRREFGLDDAADEAFPEIRMHRRPFLTDERKQRVCMAAVYPDQAIVRCTPRALVFPKIVDAAASEVTEVSDAEAMFRLTQQSILLTVDAGDAAAQVAVLRRLAAQARSYELAAGRDLLEDRSLASRLLEPCVRRDAGGGDGATKAKAPALEESLRDRNR